MRHSIQLQTRVRATHVRARERDPFRRQSFADNENYAERFLDDPMLEIENAESGENSEAQQREQLIPPFHLLFCNGGVSASQHWKPLVDLPNLPTMRVCPLRLY